MGSKKTARDTSKKDLASQFSELTNIPGRLIARLGKTYPDARSELNFANDYQLVVAVVLSAQCTDKKVNQVTPELFKAFPGFKTLATASIPQLEQIIRPINYYKTKTKNIIKLAQSVMSDFGGSLPRTHQELLSLPGVGRKTANVVLCEQGEFPALPVDTHVFRVSHRLGLSQGKGPDEVEQDLMRIFKPSTWHGLHHGLIFHGRRVCKAQRPLCSECALWDLCPSFRPEVGT